MERVEGGSESYESVGQWKRLLTGTDEATGTVHSRVEE